MRKIFLPVLSLTFFSFAQAFDVSLSTDNPIPSYCQQTDYWCGAASGQMMLKGFPGETKFEHLQSHVWDTIQEHKVEDNWYTDPDGLRTTLEVLSPESNSVWAVRANPEAQKLMYATIRQMSGTKFPSSVLVYGFAHWIVITGFKTDVDPRENSRVVLQQVEIENPWPPCTDGVSNGLHSIVTGEAWYQSYWYETGDSSSKWDGNYVAVSEVRNENSSEGLAPPEVLRQPENQRPAQMGGDLGMGDVPNINSEKALQIAKAILVKMDTLTLKKEYAVLKNAVPTNVEFVQQENATDYILIQLKLRSETKSKGAIILNGKTGALEELAVFDSPIKEVLRMEAQDLAAKAWGLLKAKSQSLGAQLVFQASDQTKSRFFPVWKVDSDGKTKFLSPDKKLFDKFTHASLN